MQFFEAWGFLALLGIPVILILYLLKQKYNDAVVSSLFLWKAALTKTQAQKPWQKLRKNLLMVLQILAVVLLAMALAKPYYLGKAQKSDYILALDCSMSMQTKDVSPSRFEAAIAEIEETVKNAPPNTGFTLLAVGENPRFVMSRSSSKSVVLEKLSEIKPSYGSVNWDETVAMLLAEQKQLGGNIYVYSDSKPPIEGFTASFVLFGQSGENCAISHVSHNKGENGYSVLVQVKNYGNDKAKRSVALFCDDVPFDVKEITIDKDQQQDVIFQNIPLKSKVFSARMTPEDILTADDSRFDVAGASEKNKVLLVTEGSLFLEKAFSLLPNAEFYKTNPEEGKSLSGYALYIFDGKIPPELPMDGHILAFNLPEENSLLPNKVMETAANMVHGQGSGRLSFMKQVQFSLSSPKAMTVPTWGEKILDYGGNAIAVAGEQEGKKLALFSFDLNQSDFPLKKEFPIIMYQLMDWFFPSGALTIENNSAEKAIAFELLAATKSANVILPNGEDNLLTVTENALFENTSEVGIYTLLQTDESGKETRSLFAVNTNSKDESDVAVTSAQNEENAEESTVQKSKSLQGTILFLLLLLLLLEWRVSLNEN